MPGWVGVKPRASLVVLNVRLFSYDWNLHSIDIESKRVDNPKPNPERAVINDFHPNAEVDDHPKYLIFVIPKVFRSLLTFHKGMYGSIDK